MKISFEDFWTKESFRFVHPYLLLHSNNFSSLLSFFLSLSLLFFFLCHSSFYCHKRETFSWLRKRGNRGWKGGDRLSPGEIEKIEEKLINNQRLSLSEPPTKGARAR